MTPADSSRLPGRLPSLTGIRAFGAFLVFVGHLDLIGNFVPFTTIDDALTPSVSMISMFFVCSGFVLAWSYRPSMSARAFLRRRVARLVPLYLAALVVATAVDVRLHTGLTPGHGWPSYLLIQSWIPNHAFPYEVNGPGWSLSDEFFFYLLFPLLLPALARMPGRLRLPLVGALAVIETAVALASTHLTGFSAIYWAYLFPPVRLCEFVAGVALSLHVRDGWRPPIGAKAAGALFLVAYAVSGYVGARWQSGVQWQYAAITFVPVCLVIATLAVDDIGGRPARVLARPTIVRLGDWSFAFYLVHQIAITVLARVGVHGAHASSPIRGLGLSVVALVVSLVGAKVLHERLEVPLEARWGGSRRVARGLEPASPATAPVLVLEPTTEPPDLAADTPGLPATGSPA